MLKNILNLEGAQKLTKSEQKSIKGGVYSVVPAGCDSLYIASEGGDDCFNRTGISGKIVLIYDRYYCCV
jgi:hypothetical protein